MSSIFAMIFAVSGLVAIVLTFYRSVSRTKSAMRWLKGYNLNSKLQEDEVFELLKRVKYPQMEEVSVGADGKFVFKTKVYQYPVELSQDENGNTTVGFIVQWGKVSKHKSKKVAMDLDNVYQFLKQEVEGVEVLDAMKAYEKSLKLQKILNIASVVLVISFIGFAIFCLGGQ